MTEPLPGSLIEGRLALADALVSAVAQARLDIRLLSLELEPALYAGERLAESLRAFLLRSERARLRVLVNDARRAARQAHRLIELGLALPSRVAFRDLDEARRRELRAEWLIVDQARLLERVEPEALVARDWPAAPLVVRERAARFDSLWDEATPSLELRRLGL